MSTTQVLPAVVNTSDDDGGQRISVLGADRAAIGGAFKPVDRPHWLMYVTKTIADAVDGSQTHPDPAPPSRRYQTNASLSQAPTTGADRPVREYVTNVSWRANQ